MPSILSAAEEVGYLVGHERIDAAIRVCAGLIAEPKDYKLV